MNENVPKRLKVLSLDGGGVRGLSTLMILERLMKGYNRGRRDGQILHPWQVFDLIGGTSTGGIIAIMLGRLRMSLKECEKAYLDLSEQIFQPRKNNFNYFGRAKGFLQADGKFDATKLEEAIKKTLTEKGFPQDALLQDSNDGCRCFVVTTLADNSYPMNLRSFDTEADNLLFGECKVWEACRATSAAPTFFDAITIGRRKQTFADGGMLHNNPIEQVYQEAESLWPEQEKLFISIGTGDAPGEAIEGNILKIVKAMSAIVTATQITAENFHKNHSSLVNNKLYFRFSVAQGLAAVGLEEHGLVHKIASATDAYMAGPEPTKRFSDCVQSLREEKSKGENPLPATSDGGRQQSEVTEYKRIVLVTGTDKMFPYSTVPLWLTGSPTSESRELKGIDATKASEQAFRKACLDSLFFPDQSRQLFWGSSADEEIEEASCTWILSQFKYKQWIDSKYPSFLWLTGPRGIGKTVLSSFIEKQLRTRFTYGQDLAPLVLSYFCDQNTDVLDLLRHLLWLCIHLRPELFTVIAGRFDPETHRLYDNEQIHGLLRKLQDLASHVQIYVIIDGLDECPTKQDVQLLIEKLIGAPFRVLLSFSDVSSLRIASKEIHLTKCLDIYVETKKLEFENLRFFANKQISELHKKEWLDLSYFRSVDRVVDVLLKKAEGCFLWLSVTCKNLRRRVSRADLTQINSLPEGMVDLLYQMICQIDPEDRGEAARVLRCLSAGQRLLNIEEIGHILSLDVDRAKRAVKCCGNLLRTTADQQVQLYHSAIRQILEEDMGDKHRDILEFQLGNMHKEISALCIKILRNELQSPRQSPNLVSHPLFTYAKQYWPIHTRLAQLPFSFENYPDVKLFRLLWKVNWECIGLGYRHIPETFSLSHVGAVFGLVSLLKYDTSTISQKFLRKKDSSGHTPLSWAAEFGHEDVIRYLFDQQDHNPNGLQGPFGNALQTASSWGRVSIVELLLEADNSDINAKDGKYGTALQAAAITGNTRILKRLIEKGADVNINRCGWFGNALQAAAANGSIEVVQLLLAADADPNAEGGWYCNALRAASTKGHVEIVRLLLSRGAVVDCNDNLHDMILRTLPLMKLMTFKKQLRASIHGIKKNNLISAARSEVSTIKSHLRRSTKKISPREAFLFALHHVLFRSSLLSSDQDSTLAVRTGTERRVVIAEGLEIHLRDLFYGDALQAAAAMGHIKIVSILIEKGADINANVGIFGTALQAAVAGNREEVVEFLLGHNNVKVYLKGGAYGSALNAAIREGHKRLEERLREIN